MQKNVDLAGSKHKSAFYVMCIVVNVASAHTKRKIHNEKWLSWGWVRPASILACRVLARSEYRSFARVIHLYKIYTQFDLGMGTQTSVKRTTEKPEKSTTILPLINFSQNENWGVDFFFFSRQNDEEKRMKEEKWATKRGIKGLLGRDQNHIH